MEQGQCWTWTKKNYNTMSTNPTSQTNYHSSYDDSSWEEKAFAKDYIWPPRSYSCSFCKREFKSAQALGGHMNVHRRDRARLKQPCSSQSESQPQNQVQNPLISSLGYMFPSSICGLACDTNLASPSKALAQACHKIPFYNSSILQASRSNFDRDEEDMCFKKRKTDATSIRLFPKSSSVGKHLVQSKMFEFSPSFIEEIDLELRLGYNPKA